MSAAQALRDHCRVCGRSPEQVAVAAASMRLLVDPALAGMTLRTRYRVIGPRASDLICFFCQRWFARYTERAA